jgi:hypothetical protein
VKRAVLSHDSTVRGPILDEDKLGNKPAERKIDAIAEHLSADERNLR